MGPGNRAFATLVLALLAVLAVGGGYLYLTPRSLTADLPVLEGTTFSLNDTYHWAAHVTVATSGSYLVGSWTAFDGAGVPGLVVVNGTVPAPGPSFATCPPAIVRPWREYHASINQPLDVGPHTIYWSTFCSGASKIVVTAAIQVTTVPVL